MNHLTDEQLSALLDEALPASERAACDAHLAGCDACRARLAEASALDASLGKALTHDPGEAYFADFAERVAQRIATTSQGDAAPHRGDVAPEAPKAQTSPAPRTPSPWAWLTSPRGLAFAGGTAALLVTAGLAWMRFHNEQDVARALREAAAPPPAALRFAPAPAEQKQARALKEVRTLANGEQVPVERPQAQGVAPEQQGHALAAPATGSALAQMKRRSVAPAAGAGAPADVNLPQATSAQAKDEVSRASRDAEAAPAPALKTAMPPAAAAPHKASLAIDTARGQSFSTWGANKSLFGSSGGSGGGSSRGPSGMNAPRASAQGLVPHCGTVRDTRGRALAGAQVTVLHDGLRTARTDADGAFCIDGLAPGDTLTVMHVGFDPWTVVVTAMTSLAIALEPVGTLGPNSTMLMGRASTTAPGPAMSFSGALDAHVPPATDSVAPAADVYASETFGIRQLARDARDATAVARRERTAPAFEHAAKQWATVLRQAKGAPAWDAGFQYVSALRTAYQLEPTGERAGRLRSGLAAFLATAPATLPEHATVARWKAELEAPSGR